VKVVVIGGGVVGTVLANLLSLREIEVTLIDSGAQRPRYPLIHSKLLRFKEDIELAKVSEGVYRELSSQLRIDLMHSIRSITIVPQECYRDEVSSIIGMWREAGVRVSIIDEAGDYGLRKVGNDEVYIISDGGDHLVDIPALIRLSRNSKYIHYVDGEAHIKFNGRDINVVVNGDNYTGDYVILTTGAWNSIMVSELGIRVPLLQYKCQAVAVLGKAVNNIVYDYVLGIYARPLGSSIDSLLGRLGLSVIVGGDGNVRVEKPGSSKGVDEDVINDVISRLRLRFGLLIRVGSGFGYCEGTPDMRPLVGSLIEDKLYILGGFNGYGAEVGPALALALVEYILGGSWPNYAKPYLIDRFSGGWPSTWDVDREAHELCVGR
jgi:glycine/D-amino acid oxidase-like deaminating enzyme